MREEKKIKENIIKIGKKLYDSGLLVGRAGNLSARIDKNNIFITATGSCLGHLKSSNIVKVNLSGLSLKNDKRPSSELPVHSLIYRQIPVKIIIHCHPPLTNAYFAVCSSLKTLTFESSFYLGDVPVVEQGTLTVTKPHLVLSALRKNNLVVVRSHGVFCIGQDFSQAFERIQILEEAVRVAAVARLFKKRALDKIDRVIKKSLSRKRHS